MLPFAKLEGYVSEDGTIRVADIVEADSPEEAYQVYCRMVNQKDESGAKRYASTRLHIAVYKQVQDPTAFFNQFKAQ